MYIFSVTSSSFLTWSHKYYHMWISNFTAENGCGVSDFCRVCTFQAGPSAPARWPQLNGPKGRSGCLLAVITTLLFGRGALQFIELI